VNTKLYIYIPTPPLSIRRINERKQNKGLDIEQIYGHGSQRGPAGAGSKLLFLLLLQIVRI
jgi:hypothetical protein